jgi:hypothetical protein
MKRTTILITLALLLLLAQAAQAMSSANYRLDWMIPLTNSGGGEASSTHYTAYYSVGQTAVGEASSTNYTVKMGFWQKFLRWIWLPLLQKSP